MIGICSSCHPALLLKIAMRKFRESAGQWTQRTSALISPDSLRVENYFRVMHFGVTSPRGLPTTM